MNRWILIHIGFPLLVFLGKLFPNKRDKLELWFINQNNQFVELVNTRKHQPKNFLLLLPHCIQNDECNHRIVKTVLNCEECGKCKIVDILKFGKKYDIIIKVATGGRLAKRLVDGLKPDFVVAVACERELFDGISAVYPLPVVGIPNIRPYGPCINTTVSITRIEDVLMKYLS